MGSLTQDNKFDAQIWASADISTIYWESQAIRCSIPDIKFVGLQFRLEG